MTSLLRFVAMVALCMFKNKMNIKIKMYVIYHPHSGMYFLPRYISFFTWDKSDMIVPGDLRRWDREDQRVRQGVLQMEREGWWRCNMWQVAVGAVAVGAVASDGNVSWQVRAGPCTTLRLLSTSARVNRVHSKWHNDKNESTCNEWCSHTYPNDARIC